MNQPTHAWLALEAYRKIAAKSKTERGKNINLNGLAKLLGENLCDVVVAAWLPDSLIKDMTYGHVFKNSIYTGEQLKRFTLEKEALIKHMPGDAITPAVAFDLVPDEWWIEAYRVKNNGGHVPARINALCQSVRDMLKMGDRDVQRFTGVKSKGSEIILDELLYSPRNIAMTLWMASHYVADAHMPFHCDNRALASTAKQKTHAAIEDLWGKQVSTVFHTRNILDKDAREILSAEPPEDSAFASMDFGTEIRPLKNDGDPWKEAVFICRTSFAASFAMIPPDIAPPDDKKVVISLDDILNDGFCGEERFWDISRAAMIDSVNAIARLWQDAWLDYCKISSRSKTIVV